MKRIWMALFMLLLVSCQTLPGDPSFGTKRQLSRWQEEIHEAQDFAFKYWLHIPDQTDAQDQSGALRNLWVVIEGDGASWSRAGNPPLDPTPLHAIGREIASAMPADRLVLYIARPCQYLSSGLLKTCAQKYWTGQRFSTQIVEAMNDVISTISKRTGATDLSLLGYSGGGVLAAELALIRPDVETLTTIASPLDLELWTSFHGISPLQSPTPSRLLLQELAALQTTKLFVFGGRDKVVPKETLARIHKFFSSESIQILPRHTHSANWARWVHERLDR